ncbi:GNAT family N-acetyltransferase [Amycolatopsis alkalitolerans]|uniref:GNAT family N-acetyltransferase n=1 Tax=Amycolatopsis alkalitolerans TaxID=2547244 RepID=A0A5C4LTE9_9PSEU|nr:GNAT family N-acetyltransferase [Amycolatopsis alkalitolerans]TNC20685.1 GNAT family N-acetyltransferase [Amycolatopsis alkalitolerans]
MQPVEINAGEYYLRQLRADERLDDRPTLVEAFADAEHSRYIVNYRVRNLTEAGKYVNQRAAEWYRDERCSWAIAEPTTGALLGEIGLKELDLEDGHGEVALWVHPAARGRGISVVAVNAAVRFGFGALELREIAYRHHPDNSASEAVAERCGFTRIGLSGDPNLPGEPLVTWIRT